MNSSNLVKKASTKRAILLYRSDFSGQLKLTNSTGIAKVSTFSPGERRFGYSSADNVDGR